MFVMPPNGSTPALQRGVSLIVAVFLITGLAVLGLLSTQTMVLSTAETVNEWYSTQALLAAESGIDWGANQVQRVLAPASTCPASATLYGGLNQTVISNKAWMSISIRCKSDPILMYEITSTGTAGTGLFASQRRLTIQYSP